MRLRLDVSPPRRANENEARANLVAGQLVASLETLPLEYQEIIKVAWSRRDHTVLPVKATAAKASTGVSTIWRDIKRGTFVPPIRLSERRRGWIAAEVDALLAAKKLMTRSSGLKVDLRQFVAVLVNGPQYGCS